MRRRAVLSAIAAGLAGCAIGVPTRNTTGRTIGEPTPPGPTVGLKPVAVPDADAALRQPTDIAVLNAGEWLVADRSGRIFAYDGTIQSEPVLEISDRVVTDGEQGVHGIAQHPTADRLYVRYSTPPGPETPETASHRSILSEFPLSADGTDIRSDSERVLLSVTQPGTEHNGGAVAVGPHGMLYTSFGSGEWVEYPVEELPPGHAEDWYDYNKGSNAQRLDSLHGSIIRVDVEADTRPYAVPDDNPLVGREGRDELFAWGFRNPWRMGFSGERLIVGDVGEYAFEEVDVVEKGGNYGWNVYEGGECFNARRPSNPRISCPTAIPRGRPLEDPVVTYTHDVRTDDGVRKANFAVIGGYIYDGSGVPAIAGEYVFGDYGGRLFVATPTDDDWPMRELRIAGTDTGRPPGQVFGFARDAAGELLVLLVGQRGGIYRVVQSS